MGRIPQASLVVCYRPGHHPENLVHDPGPLLIVAGRFVPGVEPVHRAEQERSQNAAAVAIQRTAVLLGILLDYLAAQPRIVTFEPRDFGGIAARQRVGLSHEHLHLGEVVHVVAEMAAYKGAKPRRAAHRSSRCLLRAFEQLLERPPRDQVQQLFLVPQVVVDGGKVIRACAAMSRIEASPKLFSANTAAAARSMWS